MVPSTPAVREALRRRLEHGVFGYTVPPPELADVFQKMLRDQFSWTTRPARGSGIEDPAQFFEQAGVGLSGRPHLWRAGLPAA